MLAAVLCGLAPVQGSAQDAELAPGKFLVASREAASAENEQNRVTVEGHGTRVVFTQIAGLIARRIVFRKKTGDKSSAWLITGIPAALACASPAVREELAAVMTTIASTLAVTKF